MDIEQIRKLLDELAVFMKKNDLSELELDADGAKVRLKKTGTQVHHQFIAAPPGSAPQPAPAPQPAVPSAAGQPEQPGTVRIMSPMVGTFYRSPKADADHFVEVGDDADEDTVLCVIEAMKVMNEIRAERKGRILEILVENGEPVEYGQPLFLVATT